MNTAKHTPGPWFYNYDDHCIVNQAGVSVVNVRGAMGGNDTNADTALIAAAPAMYEALKALHSVLDQRMPDGRTLNQHLSQEVFECFYGPAIAARAAIAKAEGA